MTNDHSEMMKQASEMDGYASEAAAAAWDAISRLDGIREKLSHRGIYGRLAAELEAHGTFEAVEQYAIAERERLREMGTRCAYHGSRIDELKRRLAGITVPERQALYNERGGLLHRQDAIKTEMAQAHGLRERSIGLLVKAGMTAAQAEEAANPTLADIHEYGIELGAISKRLAVIEGCMKSNVATISELVNRVRKIDEKNV